MVSVKILGVGCPKCRNLEAKVRELLVNNNIEAEVTKVDDIVKIMGYGIMMTPGLVVNEKVKSSGIIPPDEQILNWLEEN
ncbi:MAG: thioredoxin family protein [Syntrophothermus sp.]